MTTPKRWIDDPTNADDFERAILRSELELDHAPPAGAERAVFERVMAVVLPIAPLDPGASGAGSAAGGGTASAGTLAKGAAALGGLGKGFALGIFVSVAAATGSHLFSRGGSESNPSPSAPSTAPPPSAFVEARGPSQIAAPPKPVAGEIPRPAVAVPSLSPSLGRSSAEIPLAPSEPAALTPGVGSVAAFPSEGAATAESRLKEEAALLRRARSELRAGALAQAFATLEASRREFTAPELTQEREAVAIELLYRSGKRAAAAMRAQDFLTRYPESPHAAAVRSFADPGH